jgi:uncharacterized membrane protein YdjX (TVP38/TMEM64 family)
MPEHIGASHRGASDRVALRLAPVSPFRLVSLAAAIAYLILRVLVPATLFGILPGTLILRSAGAGPGLILACGETRDPSILPALRLLLPLPGLSNLLVAVLRQRAGAHA